MIKLEINHKKKTEKHTKTWRLTNMLLNNEWVNNKIKEEIVRYLETNKNENTTPQNLWDKGKGILGEIHSVTRLPQETRKISNKQPKLRHKGP